jgi:predicted nucleic acid-binding protein
MNDIPLILSRLKNKRVYFDTNPIIYFIEQNQTYFDIVSPIFQLIGTDEITAITSEFTLTETLIKPIRESENQIVQDIKDLLLDPELFTLTKISKDTCLRSAEIGGISGMRPADALHFVSAIENNCHYFITNDKKFRSQNGVTVLFLSELKELKT